jgi:hypothetical protein
MCRWQFYSRRRRKHFLLFFTNKIHSYFFYSYTDARVEATNRINKRERGTEYTRVCFHRSMIVVSMKYWFDKRISNLFSMKTFIFYLIQSQSSSLYFLDHLFFLKWSYWRYSIKLIAYVTEDDNSIIDILCAAFSMMM